jgi:hypothetical protein
MLDGDAVAEIDDCAPTDSVLVMVPVAMGDLLAVVVLLGVLGGVPEGDTELDGDDESVTVGDRVGVSGRLAVCDGDSPAPSELVAVADRLSDTEADTDAVMDTDAVLVTEDVSELVGEMDADAVSDGVAVRDADDVLGGDSVAVWEGEPVGVARGDTVPSGVLVIGGVLEGVRADVRVNEGVLVGVSATLRDVEGVPDGDGATDCDTLEDDETLVEPDGVPGGVTLRVAGLDGVGGADGSVLPAL